MARFDARVDPGVEQRMDGARIADRQRPAGAVELALAPTRCPRSA